MKKIIFYLHPFCLAWLSLITGITITKSETHATSISQEEKNAHFSSFFYADDRQGMDFWLGMGADINCPIRWGHFTPLMVAIADGKSAIIEYLLKNEKLDINKPTGYGKTALMFAAEEGDFETFTLLFTYGANPALVDASGNDALAYAYTCLRESLHRADLVGLHGGCWGQAGYESIHNPEKIIKFLLQMRLNTVKDKGEQLKIIDEIIDPMVNSYKKNLTKNLNELLSTEIKD